MKPVQLVLSAFGSYGGTEVVDFEKNKTGDYFLLPEIQGREKRRFLTAFPMRFTVRQAASAGTGK